MINLDKRAIEILGRFLNESEVDVITFTAEVEYNRSYRKYHNMTHINKMIDLLLTNYNELYNEQDIFLTILAIIYHDIVYDVINPKDNERKSALLCEQQLENILLESEVKTICNAILCTEMGIKSTNHIEDTIQALDVHDLYHGDRATLLTNNKNLFLEYQHLSYKDWNKGSKLFLDLHFGDKLSPERMEFIKNTIDDVKEDCDYTVGVFAGSFNPWHRGHQYVLDRAKDMFDIVVVLVGKNYDKLDCYPDVELDNTRVIYSNKLLFQNLNDIALEYGKSSVTLIRGVRNAKDFDYDKEMIRVNETVSNTIPTVFILAPRDLEYISSTLVRTLEITGVDKNV